MRREREVETEQRANQYVRAIRLYYRKFGHYPGSVEQLEKTERGLRLTLHQTKGSQTDAVIVPLPLWPHWALPGARADSLARGCQNRVRPGVPAYLVAEKGPAE